jgi:hypothetical protein
MGTVSFYLGETASGTCGTGLTSLGTSSLVPASGCTTSCNASANLAGVTSSQLGGIGTPTVTACFSGDGANDAPSSNTTSVTVESGTANSTTKVTLTSGTDPSTYGASLTFTATVTTGATGSVTFYRTVGGGTSCTASSNTQIGSPQTLSGGSASVSTTTMPVGSVYVLACYGGDSNYNSSRGFVAQTVNKASSTTNVTLTSGTNPSTFGASLTFTAAVTPGATGGVTFYNQASGASCSALGASTKIGSGQTLSGGSASVTTTTLPTGSDTILACYVGDSNYTSSSGTVSHTVNKASSTTNVTLTSGTNPSTSGTSLTFTATVTTGATGSVSFYNQASGATCAALGGSTQIGSTQTLSGGSASVTTTTLPTGSDTILACYGGSSNYNSSSGTVSQTVNP